MISKRVRISGSDTSPEAWSQQIQQDWSVASAIHDLHWQQNHAVPFPCYAATSYPESTVQPDHQPAGLALI